jgi:hypothetical protein
MGSEQDQPSQERTPREESQGFLITLGKALLTAILGLAALVALAATVCGMVLTANLPQGGWPLTIISAVVLIALVWVIRWLWR